jgi:hypothetical protein
MEKRVSKRSPLAEVEREVLAEGQEWMRRRLEQRLAELARNEGKLSPPQRAADPASAPLSDPDSDVRRVD